MSYFKFHCPHCDQRIEAALKYVHVSVNCPTCKKSIVVPNPSIEDENDISGVKSSLSGLPVIERSLKIIDNLADVLEHNNNVNGSGFIKLSTVGAKDRDELAKSFYIRLADDFRTISKTEKASTASKMIDELTSLLSGIMQNSLWGFTAVIPDFELEPIAGMSHGTASYNIEHMRLFELSAGASIKGKCPLARLETLSSFVNYLRGLNVSSSAYWPLIFLRIGLKYPSSGELYRRAASKEACADSQYLLGLAFAGDFQSKSALDESIQIDYVESAKWFSMAAKQGHKSAQMKMGLAYKQGNGVQRDIATAAEFFHKAADQGLPIAQMLLASSYRCGEGVKKDEEEAAKWYQRAADQGHAEAQYCLGLVYSCGVIIPNNFGGCTS